MKADEWGKSFIGLMGLEVHELIDYSMHPVQEPTNTGHYYYTCEGYPEFRDKEGKRWWGIYELKDCYIWCKNDLNGYHVFHCTRLELVK